MTIFSAVVDTATNHVKGLHTGAAQPSARAGEEFVEITEIEYAQIGAQLKHEQGGGARWRKDTSGAIVLRQDTRPQLQVTLDKTEAAVGEAIAFDFQVLDKDGNPITPTATRKLGLQSDDGRFRHWRVAVTNGTRSGSKALAEAGRYTFVSDGSYRIVGDTAFTVYEDF